MRRVLFPVAALAFVSITAALYLAFRFNDAGGAQSHGALVELGRSGALVRTFAPRLSHQVSFRKCVARPAPGSTIPRAECDGDLAPPQTILELSMRAAREVRESGSPQALHASALIDLVWSDTAGIPLDRSISYLQTAARLSERPGAVLADLAAAHLVRAGRTQNVRDLLEAIDVAERSLAAEPRNPAGLFNLALALEWLGVDGQAEVSWRDFLSADSTSGWADEARAHLRARSERTPPRPPAPGAPPAEIAGYAADAPQEARVHGWNVALGEWGSALLRGDVGRAQEWLRTAEVLGRELERRGGDASLADAVRAIYTAQPDTAATGTLAEAHRAFAAGQAAFGAAEFPAAGEHFARIAALRPPSPTLSRWAGRMQAGTFVVTGRMEEAEQMLVSLIAATDSLRYPALAGHEQWALATTRLRLGRYQGALEAAQSAERLLARAHEREGAGGAMYVRADIEYALGSNTAAYGSVHRALLALRPYRTSSWRGNVLASGTRASAVDGFIYAALRLQDERVDVTNRSKRLIQLTEAVIARAELRRIAGQPAGAAADLRMGEALVDRLPSFARNWIMVDLQLARAAFVQGRFPHRAAATLDSVIDAPDGPRPSLRRLQALVARVDARLASGNTQGAGEDLERATALLDAQRQMLAGAPIRASFLDAARAVFDRMVMLKVAAGDTQGALAYLEWGRTSLARTRGPDHQLLRPLRMEHGRVGLTYALVGDTLLAWTLSGDTVTLSRSTVRRETLLRRTERVRSALELRVDEPAVRADLSALYDQLIRPVAARLGPEGREVVIVADGEISGVPFAALYDSARARYFVEVHSSSFAATLRDALRRPAPWKDPGKVVLVSDPAFDAHAYPELARLPAAHDEVAALASDVYPDATVLSDRRATASSVARALTGAEIFHFAGHATFDDTRPELSRLVLAPGEDGHDAGALTATDFARLDLNSVRLVVLSACQTLRARSGRSGGFAGFAGALIEAGAGGVLGSLWRVDDELTRAMMDSFHQEYRRSGNAPRALRAAQLQLLRSSNPAFRAPAAWAGFRYAGV
jgi:CHAT domain-containing protein/tetratricopeptide (TPR) repeat protein